MEFEWHDGQRLGCDAPPKSTFYQLEEVDLHLRSPIHEGFTLAAQANYVPESDKGVDSLAAYLRGVFREPILAGRFAYSKCMSVFKAV